VKLLDRLRAALEQRAEGGEGEVAGLMAAAGSGEQIEDRGFEDIGGEFGLGLELAAGIALRLTKPFEMFRLRGPRGIVGREFGTAVLGALAPGDEQISPMIYRDSFKKRYCP